MIKQIKFNNFSAMAMLHDFDQYCHYGVLGMFFVEWTIWVSTGTGNGNVASWFFLGGLFWGLSLIWWAWGVVHSGGAFVVNFYMAMFCILGAPPPLVVGAFSWFLIYLVLIVLAFSQQQQRQQQQPHTHTHKNPRPLVLCWWLYLSGIWEGL